MPAQDRKALEQERYKIIEQIEVTKDFLDKTLKEKNATIDDYQAIQTQIDYRERLIDLVKAESQTLEEELLQNEINLDTLQKQLTVIEEKYKELLRWAYLQKRTSHLWSAILSAPSLNDAFLRWRYFNQIKDYLKQSVQNMYQLQERIENKNEFYRNSQEEKQKLLESELMHFEVLRDELSFKNGLLTKLKSSEKKLRNDLNAQKVKRERLNKAIENVIIAEIEARRKAARANNNLEATPEAKALSKNFLDNKGNLPWPVDKGFISQQFGKQGHPSLKNISIENNGIDIRSELNGVVKAVFKGEVVGVMSVPGHDNMVIVRHGEYYSVYSKLAEVFVQKGQEIMTAQNIGVLSQNENKNSVLHLEIWKGKTKINPAQWLVKK
jgi:septal ring factor EnvC (AmiA/AmiB activator)